MLDLCSIRRLQSALRRFEDNLKAETGLSLNEAMCLCSLRDGPLGPGELAKELSLSPSRLTRVLDGLEAQALIIRERSCDDRRACPVTLSRSGVKLVEKYRCSEIELPKELAFTQKTAKVKETKSPKEA
jgi:DNA-binding MarR family transcriptional regulator